MKQYIFPEEYYKLKTEKARLRLKNWCISKSPHNKVYDETRLTIGQMIEFLIEFINNEQIKVKSTEHKGISIQTFGRNGMWNVGIFDRWSKCDKNDDYHNKAEWYANEDNLCDALWEAVKEVLEKI